MNREQVLERLARLISDDVLVVASLGEISFHLYKVQDRPRNLYVLGSFGMASSIGLGLALARREPVVVLDGDGAALYNLGGLSTEGRYAPANLLHLILDNGVHATTGGQVTAASRWTDLADVARACGLHTVEVTSLHGLDEALRAWTGGLGPLVAVVRIDDLSTPALEVPPLEGPALLQRFRSGLSGGLGECQTDPTPVQWP